MGHGRHGPGGAAYRREGPGRGTRGSGAWRVAYRSGGTKRARALIGDALFPYTGVWRGVHIVAEFGTNCHYGTYRYAIGPQIADALAGYRGRT